MFLGGVICNDPTAVISFWEKKNMKSGLIAAPSTVQTIHAGMAQCIGHRDQQQDACAITDVSLYASRGVLAVLSDGVGGTENGAQAARQTVEQCIQTATQFSQCAQIPARMEQLVRQINEYLCLSDPAHGGATLAMAFLYQGQLFWACVGDSRVVLVRGGRACALNEDHNLYNIMLSAHINGRIDRQTLHRNLTDRITVFLGAAKPLSQLDLSIHGMRLLPDDRILICSDGLHRNLSDAVLRQALRCLDPQNACELLVQRTAGKTPEQDDNRTAVLLHVT